MSDRRFEFKCRKCGANWHKFGPDIPIGAGAINNNAIKANNGNKCPDCNSGDISLVKKSLA